MTGFGLAGHALEMARGAHRDVLLDWSTVPLPAACETSQLDSVLAVFARHDFAQAAVVRQITAYADASRLRVS